jgi:two-component system sensor histidine kinase CpxA
MLPGKLYVKILLSFLAVLGTTLLVVFILFTVQPGKYFTTRLEEYARARALKVQAVLSAKLRAAPDANWARNESLQTFVSDFGDILGARIWMARPDGTVLLKSFPGAIPPFAADLKYRGALTYEQVSIYRQRGFQVHAVIPLAFPAGDTGILHILFDRLEGPLYPGRGFALGLLIIGLMAALLIVPVSRIITSRLERLRQSAQTLAEGNLAHRAAVRGRDEIGELARAFNRMAEKLETMIFAGRELTANISHELRTPLTRIRIAEEMLRGKPGPDTPQQERLLDAIREDIEELDRLIGRILELSKMDMQDTPLTVTAFDPAELLQTLLQRFQAVCEHKGLAVTTDLSGPSSFSGDKEALTTAFLNLLDNAVKFTPEKGRISLGLRQEAETLDISLTNTFEKLSEEERTKIFDPFHQIRRSPAAGSGLGLAIAKKIIERHGGRIGAYNVEAGLEMRIVFPKRPPSP